MSDAFDPYHRWLGIPPKDQPPNHYRLLAIELFEPELEVIRDAAEQRMAHVRTYQLGPHSATSQKILNELAAAKACLLDPKAKAQYDRQLKRRAGRDDAGSAATGPDPLAFLGDGGAPTAAAAAKESAGPRDRTAARKEGRPVAKGLGGRAWVMIGSSVGAVALALVVTLALVFPDRAKTPKPPASAPGHAAAQPADGQAESPPVPANAEPAGLSEAPTTPPTEAPAQPDEHAVYSVLVYPGSATLSVERGKASVEGSGGNRTITVEQPRVDRSLLLVAECDGYQRAEKWLFPMPGSKESVTILLERTEPLATSLKAAARRKRKPGKARRAESAGEATESEPDGPIALLAAGDLRQWKVFGTSRPVDEVASFEAGTVRFREAAGLFHMGMARFPNCLVEFEYRYDQGAGAEVYLKGNCGVQIGHGNAGLLTASDGKTFQPLVGQRTWNDEYNGNRFTTIGYLAAAEKPNDWNTVRIACQEKRWTVVLNNRIVNHAECSIAGKYPFWINGKPGFALRNVTVAGLSAGEDPLPKLGASAARTERRKVFVFNGTSAIVTQVLRTVPVTLEAWIWVEPAPQSTDMFVVGSDDLEQAAGLGLRISREGNPGIKRSHRDVAMTGFWCPARIPDKVWVHLATTFDQAEACVFVNGAMAHRDKLFEQRGNAPFVIGYIGYGKYQLPQCYFSGKMRAVRITSGIRYHEDFVPDAEFRKTPGEKDFRTILIYDAMKTRQGVPVDLSGNRNDGHPLNIRIEDADVPTG